MSDGRALPAGELACIGRVTPPTASAHLAKLVAGGLLAVEREGRHRYYRLAHPVIVRALEALAAVAPPGLTASRKDVHAATGIRFARTCCDHLAGALGAALCERLFELAWLERMHATRAVRVTNVGRRALRRHFGVVAY